MSLEIYAPQLVGKSPKNYLEMFKDVPIIGTVKKDGYWSQLIKDNNEVHLYSRSISKKTGFYSDNIDKVPHLKDWAMSELPNGTCIIGEVYYPNGTSKNVTSVLGALPEKAIARQNGEYGKLHFYMHDILAFNGEDYVMNGVPYGKRYSNLCGNIDIGCNLIPEIENAVCYDNAYLDLDKTAKQMIANGEEGMVFRTEDGLYAPGKRQPKTMFKIKRAKDSLDFIITKLIDPVKEYAGKELKTWPYYESCLGYKIYMDPSKTVGYFTTDELKYPVTKDYYMGWKNGFELSAYNDDGELEYVGRVSSGISDMMKKDMTEHPDKYIGNVCEINCMSVDNERHTFRHPYVVRAPRTDKPATDCKISEIFS